MENCVKKGIAEYDRSRKGAKEKYSGNTVVKT
jgi:hypothetical protein